MKILHVFAVLLVFSFGLAHATCYDNDCDHGGQENENNNVELGYELSTYNEVAGNAHGSDWTEAVGLTNTEGDVWQEHDGLAEGGLSTDSLLWLGAGSVDEDGSGSQTYVVGDIESHGSIQTFSQGSDVPSTNSQTHLSVEQTGAAFGNAEGDSTYSVSMIDLANTASVPIGGDPSASLHAVGMSAAGAFSSGENGDAASVRAEAGVTSSGYADLGTQTSESGND